MKNEKGYALLMVMMLVLLFTTLGMGLLAMNINASKQFNNKEEQVQARHQAEMGLLHYKSEVENIKESFVFQTDNKLTAHENLEKNVLLICNLIDNINTLSSVAPSEGKNYQANFSGSCGLNEEKKVEIKVTSEGISNKITKKVDGTIKLNPPLIESGNNVPEKPTRPPGYEIVKDFEEYETIEGYTEIDGPFSSKKAKYHFMDSFVVNKIPDDYKGNGSNNCKDKGKGQQLHTFKICGGSSDDFIIEKDLYIDGNFFTQNHACIFVKGNLTINGTVELNNKSYIIVLGNAYFKGSVLPLHNNAGIFVAGNTYVGAEESITSTYNDFKTISKGCTIPTNWPNPETDHPDADKLFFGMEEELYPYYH